MIGLYKRTDTEYPSKCESQGRSNNNTHIRVVKNIGNNCNSPRSNGLRSPDLNPQLEHDQRYNFYRYYGKIFIIIIYFVSILFHSII